MIQSNDNQSGCRYFRIVIKFALTDETFALPFGEIRV